MFCTVRQAGVAANNGSWGWNFTKAFFGGLVSSAGWKSVYHSIVDEGGCDNLMSSTFADVFNPLPGDGVGASDACPIGGCDPPLDPDHPRHDPKEPPQKPANNGNPIVPANPCNRAGNAPDPSVYQAKGQTAQNNSVADLYYLFQFRAGGGLDAQPQGSSPAYANYAYGVYMSAAGYTLNQALTGADIYAQYRASYRPGTVDRKSTRLNSSHTVIS